MLETDGQEIELNSHLCVCTVLLQILYWSHNKVAFSFTNEMCFLIAQGSIKENFVLGHFESENCSTNQKLGASKIFTCWSLNKAGELAEIYI